MAMLQKNTSFFKTPNRHTWGAPPRIRTDVPTDRDTQSSSDPRMQRPFPCQAAGMRGDGNDVTHTAGVKGGTTNAWMPPKGLKTKTYAWNFLGNFKRYSIITVYIHLRIFLGRRVKIYFYDWAFLSLQVHNLCLRRGWSRMFDWISYKHSLEVQRPKTIFRNVFPKRA